jgi:hypothetical protein
VAVFHSIVFGTPVGGLAVLESSATHRAMHGTGAAFSGNFLEGLAGVILSPSRGLVLYSPVVLLSVAGAFVIWRHNHLARWWLLLPVAGFVLAWGKLGVWWGGHTYGPRYAADLVVPLALLAAAACGSAGWRERRRWAKGVAISLLLWSVGVHAIGAFFYPGGRWDGTPQNVDLTHSRLWEWHDPQILRELKAGPYLHHLEPLKRIREGP